MLVLNTTSSHLKNSKNTKILNNNSRVQKRALSIAKKIAKGKDSHGTVLRSQLVEELRNECPDLSILEITVAIHQLVEQCRLIPVADSFFVEYRTYKTENTFELRQKSFQDFWLMASEAGALQCYQEEEREYENASILRFEQEEKEQSSVKRKQRREFKESQRRFRY